MLRHLHYFATVAEEGHVGRAAARLMMAQPPLSQAIARLEKSLGIPLFVRGPRGMSLTDAGRTLLPRARALLEDERSLRRTAVALADSARILRLGVVPGVGTRISTVLATAAASVDGSRVEMVVGPSRDLRDAVRIGELDLALLAHPVVADGMTAGPVRAIAADLLIPADHRAAASGGPVAIGDLHDLAPALPPRSFGPPAHDVLVDTLDLRGCTRRPVEVGSPAAGLAAVATGRAFLVTVDPDLGADGIARRPTAGDPLLLRYRLVWRDGTLPDAVRVAVQQRFDAAMPHAR